MNKEIILKQIEDILKTDYSNNIILNPNKFEIKYEPNLTKISFVIELENYNSLFITCMVEFNNLNCNYIINLKHKLDGVNVVSLNSNSNLFEIGSVCKVLNIYEDLNLYIKKFILQLKDINLENNQ